MSLCIFGVLILHKACVISCGELGGDSICQARPVIPYSCNIQRCPFLHVCKVVQHIDTLEGRKRHLVHKAIRWCSLTMLA